jgi:hypothetical protein
MESSLKQQLHLKKEWLIRDAIGQELTQSTNLQLAELEFTCHGCQDEPGCRYAWDAYNLHGDCLASK